MHNNGVAIYTHAINRQPQYYGLGRGFLKPPAHTHRHAPVQGMANIIIHFILLISKAPKGVKR